MAARRRTPRACGGDPLLAAAHAEALPLADGAVSGVISLDVIEHVAEPRRYLREIERVLAPGGNTALSTPNRFSLAAEPHVFVWGSAGCRADGRRRMFTGAAAGPTTSCAC